MILGLTFYFFLEGQFDWSAIIVIIIILLFLAFAIPRYILGKNDVVEKDEYSKKIVTLAASRSYFITIYMWLILMYFDDFLPETSTQIGLGISLMAVVFLINALIIKFTGVKE
jgi:hypothetical protein